MVVTRLWGHKKTAIAELRGGNEEKVVRIRGEECSLHFMDIFDYEC